MEYIHFQMKDGREAVMALKDGRQFLAISQSHNNQNMAILHYPSEKDGASCDLVPPGSYCDISVDLPLPSSMPTGKALEQYLREAVSELEQW